ncbi:MAG: TetR/AcrR family transcriptional regulator [Deltaproteobacteria bacterium]|nr:TetR/AcrR family transcriptional regulator [Deltaproteobacteria bacterium]
MPRAKLRTPELRDRLLQVAMRTLATDGVEGFTTRKVAQQAETSPPAVYELFGDRAGLVREVFFEGFRQLRQRFDPLRDSADPRADLVRVIESFRGFVRQQPVLAEVMFARPFRDFDPGPLEQEAGSAVRLYIVGHVQRCIDAGVLVGDATDIAHVLVALTRGLAATERAGWLGRSQVSVDRRWGLAFRAVLDGLASPPSSGRR